MNWLFFQGLDEKICGNETIRGVYTGAGNILTVEYMSSQHKRNRWRIRFTAFHTGKYMKLNVRVSQIART